MAGRREGLALSRSAESDHLFFSDAIIRRSAAPSRTNYSANAGNQAFCRGRPAALEPGVKLGAVAAIPSASLAPSIGRKSRNCACAYSRVEIRRRFSLDTDASVPSALGREEVAPAAARRRAREPLRVSVLSDGSTPRWRPGERLDDVIEEACRRYAERTAVATESENSPTAISTPAPIRWRAFSFTKASGRATASRRCSTVGPRATSRCSRY